MSNTDAKPTTFHTLPREIRQRLLDLTFSKQIHFEAQLPERPYSTITNWASDLRRAFLTLSDNIDYAEKEATNEVHRRFESLDDYDRLDLEIAYLKLPKLGEGV